MIPPSRAAFEFQDSSGTQYAFDVDRRAEDTPIRARVASSGVGAVFDLSVVGAQRFSMMLSSAITQADLTPRRAGGRAMTEPRIEDLPVQHDALLGHHPGGSHTSAGRGARDDRTADRGPARSA
jgi:hypothetical protein